MILTLNIDGSVPLSKFDIHEGEEQVIKAIKTFVKKNLGLNSQVLSSGAGTDFKRRDASCYVVIRPSDLPRLAKKIPARKNLMVGPVRIETEHIRVDLVSEGMERQSLLLHKGKWDNEDFVNREKAYKGGKS